MLSMHIACHEMAAAFPLVPLFDKRIIFGQRVPDEADHGKPRRRFGGRLGADQGGP